MVYLTRLSQIHDTGGNQIEISAGYPHHMKAYCACNHVSQLQPVFMLRIGPMIFLNGRVRFARLYSSEKCTRRPRQSAGVAPSMMTTSLEIPGSLERNVRRTISSIVSF